MARHPGIIDEVDRQLLGLLQTNSRQSTTALAKRLRMARSTIHERICRLEREGVIRGYSVDLGRSPFDGYAQAVVHASIDLRRKSQILDRLVLLPEVRLCSTIAGEYDLLLLIHAPLPDDLEAVIEEIAKIPHVERCRAAVILNVPINRRVLG